MIRIRRPALAAALCLLSGASFSSETQWQLYTNDEDGFLVEMPDKPRQRSLPVPKGQGELLIYEAFATPERLAKYSIFVNRPERGMFDPESQEAFLNSHVKSLGASLEQSTPQLAQRTTFAGQPAMEYAFNHVVQGVPYVARGFTFIVDGGYMRVGVWYPKGMAGAEADFKRFSGSFALMPIGFQPVKQDVVDQRGISFRPPVGWKPVPLSNPMQVARYGHLTHSLQVLASSDPRFTCAVLEKQFQDVGRLTKSEVKRLSGQNFRKLTGYELVPKYNVRLTTVQYCLDSRMGAVFLGGAVEDSAFSRWERVLEGAASTMRVQ